MHQFDDTAARTMIGVLAWAFERLRLDPPPLDNVASREFLAEHAPSMINEHGTAPEEVLNVFEKVLAPAVISIDSPRYLSFIPTAPTKASLLFDLVVSAGSLNGISWLDASGAVWAENQALRFLSDLAGMPPQAGGCFVSGGSAANLSALAVARDQHRLRHPDIGRSIVLAGAGAHSSVVNTARLLDVELIKVHAQGPEDRLTAAGISRTLGELVEPERVCAIVATAGATNTGVIDDLTAAADAAERYEWWYHVDAAYGGAALLSQDALPRFAGIDRADSLTIDPHKWLFAPFDCGALIYREPWLALPTHTQSAGYLDVLHEGPEEWNPSDYAYHLSRRARGLPLWFSLSVYGVAAYRSAVDTALALARYAAERIRTNPDLELCLEPELSVVVFRRRGWTTAQYRDWSDRMLELQLAFVVPSTFHGSTVLRFAFLHPGTTHEMIDEILDSLS
jgi:glutamate/tyrosine decarboxylase-like PLP-dependent enzyme